MKTAKTFTERSTAFVFRAGLVLAGAVLLLALIAPPAAAKRRPKWVKGKDRAYPTAKFMLGVGVGADLDSARSSARAEISRVFRARVQQTLTDTQTESSESVGKKRGPARGTQASRMVTEVTTESLLEGVRIAETWHHKRKKKYYALAVLDKTEANNRLSAQIVEKEERITGFLAQAKATPTPIEKARATARALQAARARDELVDRRRILDPVAAPGLSNASSTARLEVALDEVLLRIRFRVRADSSEQGSRLREAVAERITGMGFKVSDGAASNAESPVLTARCGLRLEPFDRGNPRWQFFKWNGTFELSGPDGKVISSAAPTGSEGHLTEATARSQTRAAGEKGVAQTAEEKISEYIFGKP